jgi:PHD/YefM family antitoxin component YafN of YafNO toxin-antitoxin module
MDRAVQSNERFIVDRRGEPAVVILSVQDYLASVQSAPDWLREAWAGAKERGLDKLTMGDIDAEISAYRREKRAAARAAAK